MLIYNQLGDRMRMFMIKVDVNVSIPSLDRWIDFQEGKQQIQINALAAQVADLKTKIVGLTDTLRIAVQDSQQ